MAGSSPELLILSTAYCTGRRGVAPYYEIIAAADRADDVPREIILSHDDAVYTAALAIEGTDSTMTIPYAAAFAWRRVRASSLERGR